MEGHENSKSHLFLNLTRAWQQQGPRGGQAYFPTSCSIQDPGGGNRGNFSLSLDMWGQHPASRWSPVYCWGGAWVGVLSWASGKTFLCEQPTRRACDHESFPPGRGWVCAALSAQSGWRSSLWPQNGIKDVKRPMGSLIQVREWSRASFQSAHREGDRVETSHLQKDLSGGLGYCGSPLWGVGPQVSDWGRGRRSN